MLDCIEVLFRTERTGYFINPKKIELEPDMVVICRVDRGEDIGRILNLSVSQNEIEKDMEIKEILRIATEEDLKKLEIVRKRENEAEQRFEQILEQQSFIMRLIDVIYQFDGNKLTFFFSSEGRIDFRDLVRELAIEFKTRIELHQTSGREDARRYGGLGICGKEYCCSQFLRKINQVTIKMAKDQNLLSNLSKISGPCGRLLCCLHFEKDFYLEKAKIFPLINDKIIYNGKEMRVSKNDYYTDMVQLYNGNGETEIITLIEYGRIKTIMKNRDLQDDDPEK